jgi:polyisoprenyl-teichoic acid--peptidoglycan teichoic acid transferase
LPDLPKPGRRLFKKYLIGIALIVVSVGAATSVAAFDEVNNVVDAIRKGDKLDLGGDIAEADAGKPQTIMLIGSDKRAKGARDYADGGARSDTLILVRLDPSKKRTALLSLPRDLKVHIPGRGVDKLNAAYAYGGARLTLKTVKRLTGLTINHVVNVDFGGFRDAVNSIGCVYVDIDRHYFNDNSGPDQYATINVDAGYQQLCGQDALDYVRYRHEDTDLVRSARQQDFIRQAKEQVGVGKIISNRRKLTKIFGKYTSSDISSRRSVLRLLTLVAASAQHPISEIHFKGKVGTSYVTTTGAQMRKMITQFLGTRESKGPRSSGRTNAKRQKETAGLEDATNAGNDQALQVLNGHATFPIYYPTKRTKGSLYAGAPRVYDITYRGRKYSSYRMVVKRGLVGEYYGLQGTTWRNAPILQGADKHRKVGKREFDIYYDGDRVRLIAWRTDQAVYWVTNTLLQSLTEKQMLEIARTTRVLGR